MACSFRTNENPPRVIGKVGRRNRGTFREVPLHRQEWRRKTRAGSAIDAQSGQ